MNQQTSDRLEAILDNDYRFQFGEYISKGFNIFGRNAGMFIGFLIVSSMITTIVSIIPLLGLIILLLISGALSVGNYIVADKTDRNEETQFGNFFDGFKHWVPLMLNILLQAAIYVAIFLPLIFYIATTIGLSSITQGERPDFSGIGGLLGLVVMAVFCLLIYVAYCFIYSPFFIVFDKMDAWEAMQMSRKFVGKHFFTHFLFFLVWGIILFISALPLLLGLVVTIPAMSCSLYAAWADITDYRIEKTEDDELMRHLID